MADNIQTDFFLSSKKNGAITIGLLGNGGGVLKNLVDISLVVGSSETPRIQEAHILIGHIICQLIEEQLFPDD